MRPPRVEPPPPPTPAAPPALKAFSGKGWRRAAPGFGDPEDRDALPPSREPKVLVGNLPTDVPPGVVREILQSHCDGMNPGDVPEELQRDVRRGLRPRATEAETRSRQAPLGGRFLVYTTLGEAAEAAATRMHGVDLHTPSKKTEGGAPHESHRRRRPRHGRGVHGRGQQGDDAPPPAPRLPPRPSLLLLRTLAVSHAHSCLGRRTPPSPTSLRASRRRLLRYLSDAVRVFELKGDKSYYARRPPQPRQYTSVKELVESVEAFRLIVAYLAAAERAREVRTFFDLACGHGLVGVLLAWAFPDQEWWRAIGNEGAFDAYARAFGAFAAADDAGVPLPVVDDAWVDVEASAPFLGCRS